MSNRKKPGRRHLGPVSTDPVRVVSAQLEALALVEAHLFGNTLAFNMLLRSSDLSPLDRLIALTELAVRFIPNIGDPREVIDQLRAHLLEDKARGT